MPTRLFHQNVTTPQKILGMLVSVGNSRGGESMLNKRVLTIFNVLILVASFAVLVRAQDAPYRMNDKEVKKLMAQLKKDTGKFRKSFDSSLDKSRLNGSNREDDYNRFLKNYEDATERLYSRFKDNKSVGADVEAVLDGANEIDRFMTRRLASERAERDWSEVRQDLRRLAEAYNVSWRWWSTD
jgi:hypothetical protein